MSIYQQQNNSAKVIATGRKAIETESHRSRPARGCCIRIGHGHAGDRSGPRRPVR